MKQQGQHMPAHRDKTTDLVISRRSALGSSGLAMLALLSDSALGQAENKDADAKRPSPRPPKEFQEGLEKQKAFMERLRNADSMEERQQIMNEQMAWQRERTFEDLKEQLRVSDREWPVVKPRLQAVYDLVHPVRPMMGRNEPPKTEVEQRSRELSELLRDEKAEVSQIKAKLTALRAAKERTARELAKARQALRHLMTVRQEALLVLNGLLD